MHMPLELDIEDTYILQKCSTHVDTNVYVNTRQRYVYAL